MLRLIGRGLIGLLGVIVVAIAVLPGETTGLLPEVVLPEEPTPAETVRTVIDSEALIDGVRESAAKEVVWAREDRARTPLALVYVHGFSASKAELRPVPDLLAERLGANLFYTRLTGHGRDGPAMGAARAEDWMRDVAEALAVGRAIGERVVILGTSMGGALTALAASQLEGEPAAAGFVLLSPAFGIQAAGSTILSWPFARTWVPWVLGPERSFVPENEAHAAGWTSAYPSQALVPLAAVVRDADLTPYDHVSRPVLMLFSEADRVIVPDAARAAAARWGGPVEIEALELGPGDDPYAHVIAGDALSPGMTEAVAARIEAWIRGRGLVGGSAEDGGDGDGGEAQESR